MILTCENCSIKFNLDESLIKESGSKVRCSKCQHIFTIYKLVHDEEPESAVELEQDLADLQDSAEMPQPSIDADEALSEELRIAILHLKENWKYSAKPWTCNLDPELMWLTNSQLIALGMAPKAGGDLV